MASDSKTKVGFFVGNRFQVLAEGSKDYCEGFFEACTFEGKEIIEVQGSCDCKDLRKEVIIRGDRVFHSRSGCVHCNKWDGPVRIKDRQERCDVHRNVPQTHLPTRN